VDSRLHGCIAAVCSALALLTAASAVAANERPDAGFGFFPIDPVAGESVRFVSYACDPDGAVFDQEWDFDGDGAFDDAFGAQGVHTFAAGRHNVALRVTPLEGAPVIRTVTLNVGTGAPAIEIFAPPLLKPFPVVRIVGQLTRTGARISFLSVRAPVCSRLTTICRGPTCPFKRDIRLVGRKGARVQPLAGRSLRAGVTLEVMVTKRDRIGKYTRLTIRRGKEPARTDRWIQSGRRAGG
jgi:hypothetical protein